MKTAYFTAAAISLVVASSAIAQTKHSHQHPAPAPAASASSVPTPTPAPAAPNAGMPAGGMNHNMMGQGPGDSGMNCPMMAGSGSMMNGMSAMMTDMRTMMKRTSDPAMKAKMQKMHDQMAGMMANMQKMSGGMSGMMKQGGQMSGSTPSLAPSAAPKDHAAHHPN